MQTMKKKLLIGIGSLVVVLVITICFTNIMRSLSSEKNQKYALNLYGENFRYTRGLEAYFDEDGALKSIEVYLIYDSGAFSISTGNEDVSEKYPGAMSTCTVDDDGSVKVLNYLTAEALEAGALTDNAFYLVNSIYDRIKTEDDIRTFFEEQIEFAKENGIPADETNYIIMNGKNMKW